MQVKIPLRAISVNEAFQGRRFKTDKCNDFCDDFLKVAPRKNTVPGTVEIEYKFYVKNHKAADYDNLIKITQDMIVKCGYIEDDRKIYKATIHKIPCEIQDERIEFEIKEYAPV